MTNLQEPGGDGAGRVRPIDWQSRAVWVSATIVAVTMGATGGMACAAADRLLSEPWLPGLSLGALIWVLAATLAALFSARALAGRWQRRCRTAGDPSAMIVLGVSRSATGRPAYFLMMGVWILVVFAVGSSVLAVLDLFLMLASLPASRALGLGGFAILGLPLLLWILGDRAQAIARD